MIIKASAAVASDFVFGACAEEKFRLKDVVIKAGAAVASDFVLTRMRRQKFKQNISFLYAAHAQ